MKQTPTHIILTREEYDQLIQSGLEKDARLFEQEKVIIELQTQVKELAAKMAELMARLSKNSQNSSKPPSSDGLSKPKKTKSSRESSGLKPGGQPGHNGYTLKFSETPAYIKNHFVTKCSRCGAMLESVQQEQKEARQAFDISPPPKVEVTEHRIFQIECSFCHYHNESSFPADINQHVQYGCYIRSWIAYMSQYQLIPVKRVKEVMKDLHGISLSSGTVQNTIMYAAQRLRKPVEAIKNILCTEDVVGFDESGFRVNRKLKWLHVASTPKLVWYGIHAKRGQEAMNDHGILPNFKGTAVHDGLESYKSFKNCFHSLCNSHHLRELTFVEETSGQAWAKKMKALLKESNAEVREIKGDATSGSLCAERIAHYHARYLEILANGDLQNPPAPKIPGKRGRTKQSYEVNLLGRLRQGMDEVLRFMTDFRVPFTNNEAERDIRMPKAKQKISGCMRSDEGAEAFCINRSYLATLKKQGYNLLDSLVAVFSSTPPEPYNSGCS